MRILFQNVCNALMAGLPHGWDIRGLRKGDSIHYYDTNDAWYVYAKSPDHYVELAFPHDIEESPAALTEQMQIAVENVLNPPDVPRLDSDDTT